MSRVAWLISAALLVGACFPATYRYRQRTFIPDFDGGSARLRNLTFNAWGSPSVTGPADGVAASAFTPGPPYGYLWLGAAALLVIGALLGRLRRYDRLGVAVGVLAATALLGSVLTTVVDLLAASGHQGVNLSVTIRPEAGAWLAVAATAFGLAGALNACLRKVPRHDREPRGSRADRSPSAPIPAARAAPAAPATAQAQTSTPFRRVDSL